MVILWDRKTRNSSRKSGKAQGHLGQLSFECCINDGCSKQLLLAINSDAVKPLETWSATLGSESMNLNCAGVEACSIFAILFATNTGKCLSTLFIIRTSKESVRIEIQSRISRFATRHEWTHQPVQPDLQPLVPVEGYWRFLVEQGELQQTKICNEFQPFYQPHRGMAQYHIPWMKLLKNDGVVCLHTNWIANFAGTCTVSAGFRWWGAWRQGVVGGPMCGYKIFR